MDEAQYELPESVTQPNDQYAFCHVDWVLESVYFVRLPCRGLEADWANNMAKVVSVDSEGFAFLQIRRNHRVVQ